VIVSILVAMDERRGIGKAGGLPWRLSADMKRFRELTMNHHIVVGRKTFESIGKPLEGRVMIVVTRDKSYRPTDCLIADSVEKAIALARERNESEVFICGGASVYSESLAIADRIYLTQVHAEVDADTFFPEWDRSEWVELESIHHEADEKNQHPFSFKLLERKRPEG
jgi:dihydrofolate reductase